MNESNGLFVAFEGGEGAGKTTQLDLLQPWLVQSLLAETGRELLRTREPGGTEIGERIRSLVLSPGQGDVDARTEALLMAASRSAHVVQRILPALDAGAVVLCDRYVDSSLAYQGVGRGLGVDSVAAVNDWATQGLIPDLTVLLDVAPSLSRERRTSRDGGSPGDRIESADDDFHTRLREAFLDRAAQHPDRYLVLDGNGPVDQIQEQIRRRVAELVSGLL